MKKQLIPLILLTGMFLGSFSLAVIYRDKYDSLANKPHTASPAAPSVNIYDLWQLTNKERETAGLEPLKLNDPLSNVSEVRCQDQVKQNYYGHVNPQGKHFWDFYNDADITYKYGGENIAAGSYTADEVNTAWMNSPEHKANILDSRFTDIGISTCHSDNHAVFGYGDIIIEDFIQAN